MSAYTDGLYRISTRKATYGVEVKAGRIVHTAPIARRYRGWDAGKAFSELRLKWGADVQLVMPLQTQREGRG